MNTSENGQSLDDLRAKAQAVAAGAIADIQQMDTDAEYVSAARLEEEVSLIAFKTINDDGVAGTAALSKAFDSIAKIKTPELHEWAITGAAHVYNEYRDTAQRCGLNLG